MIIHRLTAENLLKYARLELTDLPERGLIAISGPNESGKSTIGESLCFALFGRTFSLGRHDIAKAIRWGEARCSSAVEFTARDGLRYRVERFLDDDGNQGARLARAADDRPLAKGLEAVDAAVAALAGFGYDELIESFYLAQREIAAPHPHSYALKAMAGVARLEEAAAELAQEIAEERQATAAAAADAAQLGDELAALAIREELLPALEAERAERAAAIAAVAGELDGLAAHAAACDGAAAKLRPAVEELLAADGRVTAAGWAEGATALRTAVAGRDPHCHEWEDLDAPLAALDGAAGEVEHRLAAFERLRTVAAGYRDRLAERLGEARPEPAQERETDGEPAAPPFADLATALERGRAAAAGSRAVALLLAVTLALLALAAGGAWGLLTQAPGSAAAEPVAAWLAAVAPAAGEMAPTALAGAGGLFALLFLLAAGRASSLGGRLRHLAAEADAVTAARERAERDAAAIDRLALLPLGEAVTALGAMADDRLAEAAAAFARGAGEPLLDPAADGGLRGRLRSARRDLDEALAAIARALADEGRERQEALELGRTGLAGCDERLAAERARREAAAAMQARLDDLTEKEGRGRHRIAVRELGLELLAGAGRHVAQRFNRDVRRRVGETLPLFTQGRYRHLQLDDALKVRVFSTAKRDFMELEEISSGTQRQIMLAVRLALSQELLGSTGGRRQFIFLDEPFAFFDEERMRAALEVLPTLCEELSQIWLIAQAFPTAAHLDRHLRCSHDAVEMVAGR